MASRTKSKPATASTTTTTMEEALEKGYLGTVADPFPNEAYSLQSGPDSPTATEVREALAGSAAAPAPAPSEEK